MKTDWVEYRARCVPQSVVYVVEALTTSVEPNLEGVKVFEVFKGEKLTHFFFKKDFERIGNNIVEMAKKDSAFINKFLNSYKKIIMETRKFFSKVKDLERLSNKELINLYIEWHKVRVKRARFANTAEIVTEAVEKEIKEKLNIKKDHYFSILTTTDKESHIREQEKDLLKILKLVQKNPELVKLFELSTKEIKEKLNSFSEVNNLIKKHKDKWFWIHNNYVGFRILDEDFFISELSTLIKDKMKAEEKLKEMNDYSIKVKDDKEKVIKSLNLNQELTNLIDLVDNYIYMQDLRKAIRDEEVYYHDLMLGEIGKRTGFSLRELKYITPEELVNISGKKIGKTLLKERSEYCVMFSDEGNVKILSGREAKEKEEELIGIEELYEDVNEVKGSCACQGYAKGKVRILFSPDEMGKLKAGEILIAENTTPDFVPAMKRAAAIVTDRGGVICHAVILSREMNKPCVVGTQIATKVFKDGDIVEINATEGILKRIK